MKSAEQELRNMVKGAVMAAALVLVFALTRGCSATCFAHDDEALRLLTLPELRAMGPVNPPNPANDGTYRDFRGTYCDEGLLKGVHCSRKIQVHHMITDKTIKCMGFAGKNGESELWKDPRNLISLCCQTDCPDCGQSCHFKIWHHGNFQSTDLMITEVFLYRDRLIEWIEENEEKGDEK